MAGGGQAIDPFSANGSWRYPAITGARSGGSVQRVVVFHCASTLIVSSRPQARAVARSGANGGLFPLGSPDDQSRVTARSQL